MLCGYARGFFAWRDEMWEGEEMGDGENDLIEMEYARD